jgi:hypothetical protein
MQIHRVIAMALLAAAAAQTQAQDVPAELSGRWNWIARGFTQTFALDEIRRQDAGNFTAKLTWWTTESRCAVRGEPITGTITATGLSFDAKTRCNVGFTVDLQRADKGWKGKATTHTPTPVVVDLTAS